MTLHSIFYILNVRTLLFFLLYIFIFNIFLIYKSLLCFELFLLFNVWIRISTGFYIGAGIRGFHIGGIDHHRYQPGERYSRPQSYWY